ncbi:protein ALP1-like [Pecten maximus]|uniref:protein ALP1-like n=1 Tax=Pecten maximus TaxID=6579 RepID=UPI0014582BCA|nr:protein ALP1-like [Pecten maximus]
MAPYRLLAAIGEDDDLMLLSLKGGELETEKPLFNFEDLTNEKCKTLFRFEKDDIPLLCHALQIPPKIECTNRTTCSGLEGICILLRRLAYPNRLSDLYSLFGRSSTAMSFIINELLDFLHDTHGHLLRDLNRSWLSEQNLDEFANAVRAREGPLPNCWGFIDGTVRPVCRPTHHQKLIYNGHKRVHALKYQSVVTPNGLVVNMFGPIEGKRHDAGMLRESQLQQQMRQYMTTPTGDMYAVYGDPAYPLTPYIITPYRGGVVSANQPLFNKKMSDVRICVEWTFGKILALFSFLDYKKNLKLYLQPVGKYYLVGTLLTNCHSCLYGNQTSQFFGVEPPTLQSYISG